MKYDRPSDNKVIKYGEI